MCITKFAPCHNRRKGPHDRLNAGAGGKDGEPIARPAGVMLSCTNAQTSWSCTNHYEIIWVPLPNRQTFYIQTPFQRLNFLFAVLLTCYWQECGNRLREFGILWYGSMYKFRIELDHSSGRDSEWRNSCCLIKMLSSWFYGREDQFETEDASSPQVTRWNENVERFLHERSNEVSQILGEDKRDEFT